jgi:hypothetical protein
MTCNGTEFRGEMGAQRQMVRAMTHSPPVVDTPDGLVTFKYELPHFFKALHGDAPVRIVSMGSSSTAGRGDDVVPYPSRLEMYLRWEYQARFPPQLKLDVLNRGKGGEEAPDELKRFDNDIFGEKPSLVIWQVGTNAVFRKTHKIKETADAIKEGLRKLSGNDFDVLLMDPQYVTAMLRDECADDSEQMVSLIAAAAEEAKVNLFRRWALMRHWHIYDNVALPDMIDPADQPDQLHQNDWSTMLIAKTLFNAIKDVFTKMDWCSSHDS